METIEQKVARLEKEVLELKTRLEMSSRILAETQRKVQDERVESGVLDSVIDKLIDKIARG